MNPAPTVAIEGPGTDPDLTHIERINRDTPNPAYIPGLDYVPPAGKGVYGMPPVPPPAPEERFSRFPKSRLPQGW